MIIKFIELLQKISRNFVKNRLQLCQTFSSERNFTKYSFHGKFFTKINNLTKINK